MAKRRVLILYTGGTFGMQPKQRPGGKSKGSANRDARHLQMPPLSPAALVRRFKRDVPELESVAQTTVEVLMNCDSAHVGPQDWIRIAERIQKSWDKVDGFVVLHGTDTMAFTASALSLLLGSCKKPVVLTGAQKPLASLRTDGRRNLVSAVEIAAQGRPDLCRQVLVFFDDQLFQGNRTRKRSSQDFRGFESPQAPVVADVGTGIRFHEPAHHASVKKTRRSSGLAAQFSTQVPMLHVTPGFPSKLVREQLLPHADGLVLVIFQSGTAPTHDEEFIALLREARRLKKPIVSVTESRTEFPGEPMRSVFYEAAKRMKTEGAFSAGDMTPECAWVKTAWILGQKSGKSSFRKFWNVRFAAEGGPLA